MEKIITLYKNCSLCKKEAKKKNGEICIFHEETFLQIIGTHFLYLTMCEYCDQPFSEATNFGKFSCKNNNRHHFNARLNNNTTTEIPELFLKLFISKCKKTEQVEIHFEKENFFNYDYENKIFKIARSAAILNRIKKSEIYKTKYKKNLDKKFTIKKKQ